MKSDAKFGFHVVTIVKSLRYLTSQEDRLL